MSENFEYIGMGNKPTRIPTTKIEEMKNKRVKNIIGDDTISALLLVVKAYAQSLSDDMALQAKAIYDDFEDTVGKTVDAGFKFRYDGKLYKTIQPSTTIQEQNLPGIGTESLYAVINETNAGTISDPIPAQANMEYEYGKYYSENGVIYLCKRGGLTDEQAEAMYGQKITLQFTPSQLIGQYFEIVL